MKMRKIDFDKGRAERRKLGQQFREKPVKTPGRSLEETKSGDAPKSRPAKPSPSKASGS